MIPSPLFILQVDFIGEIAVDNIVNSLVLRLDVDFDVLARIASFENLYLYFCPQLLQTN